MLIIGAHVHNKENPRMLDTWTRAGAFMEDLQSHVWLEFNHRWFGVSDYTTLYHEIEEFFTNLMESRNGLRMYERDGLIDPYILIPENPIINDGFLLNDGFDHIEDRYIKPDLKAWEEFRNAATSNPNQSF